MGETNTDAPSERECPYCKEPINAAATKCPHCRSAVQPESPSHGGECPYCKEQIKPGATKCKHCSSNLAPRSKTGCGCGCETAGEAGPRPSMVGLRIGTQSPGGGGGGGIPPW